jgi:hypothetical protein
MSQVSRPFQIALAAVLVLAVAWFAVLRQHVAKSSESTSTPSVAATSKSSTPSPSSAAAQEKAAAKPTHVYKGSAPGVEGLTRDVRRAHETVGKSQVQARHVEAESGEAGSSGSPRAGSQGSGATSPASSGAGSTATHVSAAQTSGAHTGARHASTNHASATEASSTHGATHAGSGTAGKSTTSSRQASNGSSGAATATPSRSPARKIEAQLKEARTVLLLFWNPHSSTDDTVREQVNDVSHSLGRKVAVNYARAGEVGAFGTVTRDVTVNETPTLLIIGKHGSVTTIAGLTDAFSIEQAIREAHS